MHSDIEIARQADIRPIADIAANLGIPENILKLTVSIRQKLILKLTQTEK